MKFEKIANIVAAVRCLNAGRSIQQVAHSAKRKPRTIRTWLSNAGFVRGPDAKYSIQQ